MYLLECRANARTPIRRKTEEHWPREWQEWPMITIGTILGIGQISLPENERRQENERTVTSTKTKGRTRLLQILISEASHLIWVLRCKRVIHKNNVQHTDQEVNARWTRVINDRLTIDRLTATKIQRNATFTRLVNATWQTALKQQHIPYQNWIHRREVFSG
jgi:hypothetical protein